MRYAIIANPISGKMSRNQKHTHLKPVAKLLNTHIYGLDTTSAIEFRHCAYELAQTFDCLVVAGGDGTFSQVINTIDTKQTVLAFLPMGSGNALRHALGTNKGLHQAAHHIKYGSVHHYDLINCNGIKKAFMASVGLEGTILELREEYVKSGLTGFPSYLKAIITAYFKRYQPTSAVIQTGTHTVRINKLLSVLIVKQPFYGYGMRVLPKARFDDGKLHILVMEPGVMNTLATCLTAFTVGNRMGRYLTTEKVHLRTERKLWLQTDGDNAWQADYFTLQLLPGALQIKR